MFPSLEKIKGIHPGVILKKELSANGIKSSQLAKNIGEHKQTISAILNKRRAINPKISFKLSKEFGLERDYFMLLQASYDVKMFAESLKPNTPNLNNLRKVLFWDTCLEKIDWDKNKKAVTKKVLERGNKTEIDEIIAFYRNETILSFFKNTDDKAFSA